MVFTDYILKQTKSFAVPEKKGNLEAYYIEYYLS